MQVSAFSRVRINRFHCSVLRLFGSNLSSSVLMVVLKDAAASAVRCWIAFCSLPVRRTRNHCSFFSSLHSFTRTMFSKWYFHSDQLPSPLYISGSTTGLELVDISEVRPLFVDVMFLIGASPTATCGRAGHYHYNINCPEHYKQIPTTSLSMNIICFPTAGTNTNWITTITVHRTKKKSWTSYTVCSKNYVEH